jgi:hypothetical protein
LRIQAMIAPAGKIQSRPVTAKNTVWTRIDVPGR